MKKFVIITDTHLKTSNIELNTSIFKQVIDYCLKYGIDECYHCGDIFTDRSGSQPLSVLIGFKEILDMFSANRIKLKAIAGNHDKVNLNSTDSYLDIFAANKNFTVVKKYDKFYENEIIVIWALPFFKEIDEYPAKLSELSNLVVKGKKNILLTHTTVDKAKNNNKENVDSEIKQSSFDAFDMVLVGHYHDYNKISNKIQYVGSAYQSNFGEDENKGFIVLSENMSIERVQLNFPKYKTYAVNVDSEIDYSFLEKETSDSDCKVRVVLTGDKTKIDSFDQKKLQSIPGVKVEKMSDDLYMNMSAMSNEETIEVVEMENIIPKYEFFCKKEGVKSTKGIQILNSIM